MGFAYQPAVWHEFYYALVQWRAMVAGDSMQDQPQLPQEQTTAEQPHPLQKQDTAEHLPSPSTEPGTYLGLERIVFFSDAVMAIAITLLVLDIRLPSLHAGTTLTSALFRLWPSYFSFAYSFLVVGSFWWGHHRIFRHVQRYDDALIWLNILFLLCIAFIPFASSVLGEHIGNPSAAVFYSLVTIMTGLAETLLWLYASRGHRLVAADLSARAIQFSTLRTLAPPTVFLLSLPLVLLSPYAAMVAWIAVYPVLVVLLRAEGMARGRRQRPGLRKVNARSRQRVTARLTGQAASLVALVQGCRSEAPSPDRTDGYSCRSDANSSSTVSLNLGSTTLTSI